VFIDPGSRAVPAPRKDIAFEFNDSHALAKSRDNNQQLLWTRALAGVMEGLLLPLRPQGAERATFDRDGMERVERELVTPSRGNRMAGLASLPDLAPVYGARTRISHTD
jgi:hypothetical protein